MAEPRNQNLRSKVCHCRFGMSLQIQAINIPPNHVWAVQFLWPWSMIALPSSLQWSGALVYRSLSSMKNENHVFHMSCPTMCSFQPQTDDTDASYVVSIVSLSRDIASCISTMLDFVHVGVLGPSLWWDDVSQDLRLWKWHCLISPLLAAPWKRTWQIQGSLSSTKIIFQSPMFRRYLSFREGTGDIQIWRSIFSDKLHQKWWPCLRSRSPEVELCHT